MAQTTDKLLAISSIFTSVVLLGTLWQNRSLQKENEQLKQQLLGPPTPGTGPQRVNTRGSYG